jgi:hypothetical protein
MDKHSSLFFTKKRAALHFSQLLKIVIKGKTPHGTLIKSLSYSQILD